MSEIIVKGKRVLYQNSFQELSLLIKQGKIVSIHPFDFSKDNTEIFDAGDLAILPGIIDTHAHINEPGRTDWEGFVTATRSAAAGGITTIIDMPLNSIPATISLSALQEKRKYAKAGCIIDYAFWGGVVPNNFSELRPMIEDNIMGFKAFLCPSGVPEFEYVKEAELRQAMAFLAKENRPLIAHAEIESEILNTLPPTEYQSYLQQRPEKFELDAIKLLIKLCRETRCKTHIVHLSSGEALPLIKQAKKEGLPLTVETCPHYLFFHSEQITTGATLFKCAPPIREKENREKLWEGVKEGVIDFIVSDHSPCTPVLKLVKEGDFKKSWGGIAGLQFSLSVVWTEMEKRGMSLIQISRLMSQKTAKFIGIKSQKGEIKEGLDADLIFYNDKKEFEVTEDMILHRHAITPYLGFKLKGKVEKTFLRGKLIYNRGQFLHPPLGQEVIKNDE